ncbi:MAG: hypothetical protein GY795_13965, partial [Desulfobacterales bacterium]|nr:hypothetical protein [Desulfobacterales bacterium]
MSDINNSRIQKFDNQGNFIFKWGHSGAAGDELVTPTGIGKGQYGNICVAELKNQCIQKFTPEGIFITKWGSSGSEKGEFRGPGGITMDEADNIYVADGNLNRIQKFDSKGKFLIITDLGEAPESLLKRLISEDCAASCHDSGIRSAVQPDSAVRRTSS